MWFTSLASEPMFSVDRARLATSHTRRCAASDVWSFGVLLWELTSFAKTPYGAIGPAEVVAELDKGYRLPQPPACPAAMSVLVRLRVCVGVCGWVCGCWGGRGLRMRACILAHSVSPPPVVCP